MNPYLGMLLRESERHLKDIAELLAALCKEIHDLNESVKSNKMKF
jgi:hypothetical protein